MFGALSSMAYTSIGNSSQDPITEFRDTEGKLCKLQEYLKTRGLFSSKSTLYLMTTLRMSETSGEIPSDSLNNDVEMSETSGNRTCSSSTMGEAKDKMTTPLLTVGTKYITDNTIEDNILCIGYELETFSSYSKEVSSPIISCTRKDCYDTVSFSDQGVLDIDQLGDFDPIDYDYKVVELLKNNKCFLERKYTEKETEASLFFPQSKTDSTNLIIHSPSEVWGYDGDQLLLCVIASCHLSTDTSYIWYHDDAVIKEGRHNCCLSVSLPGKYRVEVRTGERKELSEPVEVFVASKPPEDHLPSTSSGCPSYHQSV